jgi:hypothetical protein
MKIAVVWDATSYGMVDSYQIRRRHFPKYRDLQLQITVGFLGQAIPNIRFNSDIYFSEFSVLQEVQVDSVVYNASH